MSTITVPLYGKFADIVGRKTTFVVGMFLFLIGSVLCAFSPSMTFLIISRAIQGIGAGSLMTVSFTITGDIFKPVERGKFMGIFSALFTITSVVGPIIGGIFVQYLSWRFIFLINLPIGLASLILIKNYYKETGIRKKEALDWWGILTFTAGILLLLVALSSKKMEVNIWLYVVSFILVIIFVIHEYLAKNPFIPIYLFRIKAILFGSIGGFFVSAAMFGAISYVPLYIQTVLVVPPAFTG
jgi:multidrug resistance protein